MRAVLVLIALMGFVAPAPSAVAQELGRLFFDATQRATLDEKRKTQTVKGAAGQVITRKPESDDRSSDAEPQSVRLPEPRITGKVIRSSGNNTVWINHHPNYKKSVEQ